MTLRKLALLTILYCFVTVPAALVILTLCFKLPDSLSSSLLTYFGVIAVGAPGAYMLASRHNKGDPNGASSPPDNS